MVNFISVLIEKPGKQLDLDQKVQNAVSALGLHFAIHPVLVT